MSGGAARMDELLEISDPTQSPPLAPLLHASVYEELRRRLITGKIVPGVGLSTRALPWKWALARCPCGTP